MTERLFVYGSLAPGRPNAHVLADVPGTWDAATVRGRLHEAGWGAAMGFPGLEPDAEGEAIHGQVFSSDRLSRHWSRLDAFEGTGYERVLVTARLADGREVDAWAYAIRHKHRAEGDAPQAGRNR